MIKPALCILLAATPGVAAGIGSQANEPAPAVSRSIRLLRDSRNPDSPPNEELVLRLKRDVTAAHPALVDLLVARRVPALEEDESSQTLSVPQRDLVLAAFASLSDGELLSQAERLLKEEDPELRARTVASRLVAMGAGHAGLSRVLSLVTPAAGTDLDVSSEDALEWSLVIMFSAEPTATRSLLRSSLGSVALPLMPALTRAIGDYGDPAGLEVLLPMAERYPSVRLQAFGQARRLGASGDEALDHSFAQLLRRHLNPEEPYLARAAALVLGELSDPGSVPQLIELLEDSPASTEAHWALGRISGLGLAADRSRWRHWLADEQAFFAASYENCLRDLHGNHQGRAVAAIRELSRHRLRRHEVAVELAYALEQAPAIRRRLLCNALEAMGSRPSAPALVNQLEDRDPVVVAAALRALRSLTDLDLPADAEIWTSALAEPR